MIHNEYLFRANQNYEIRHDNNGNAIHVFIKDTYANIYPTLESLIKREFLSEEVEEWFCVDSEQVLSELYTTDSYDYYELKKQI